MGIEVTYHDGNPEDRAYARDFWAWLEKQPQQAWLYYARTANWDQAQPLFVAMARHPRCDRALASWLFWSSDPAHPIRSGARPDTGTLIGAILARSEQDGFRDSRLHYARVEVALDALQTADALERLNGPPPFPIPRALCASFEGRNPDVPRFDPATERDLEAIFRSLDGRLPRSDADSLDWMRTGGNWWYEKALRLPSAPRATTDMSDSQAIDAVFGDHRSSLARIEAHRLGSRRGAAASPTSSAAATKGRGLNADPRQRWIGLGLLLVSALTLLGLLVARLAT